MNFFYRTYSLDILKFINLVKFIKCLKKFWSIFPEKTDIFGHIFPYTK